MVEQVQNLTHYNWFIVVSAVIVAMVVFKGLCELFDWFVKRFGLETKGQRERREEKEKLDATATLAQQTAENLDKLEAQHTKDEKEFRENLNRHMTESEKDRKAMRQDMKQYSDNRIKDREQSFKIQKELIDAQTKISDSVQGLKDSIKIISDTNVEKDKQITSLIQAQKEMLAEKINEKYKYYLSIGGVPEDERDEFISLHDAYKGVGGNHNGDAKFEYCINHLPIIPVETKLVFDGEE